MKRFLVWFFLMLPNSAWAACAAYNYNLTNGQTADASQVMDNFNTVRNCANSAVQTSSVNAWSAGQSSAPVALSYGATVTPDFSTGNTFTVTLTGNATLANPTNQVAGQCGQIFITQDATGSRTLSFGSAWKFPGGNQPTLTATAGATDVLSFCSWTTSLIAAQLTADLR